MLGRCARVLMYMSEWCVDGLELMMCGWYNGFQGVIVPILPQVFDDACAVFVMVRIKFGYVLGFLPKGVFIQNAVY